MIVRDEAHVVREALDSIAPYIDYWVVVDTGSVDGTQAMIRSHMKELGIAGELHESPWRDFGRNRTEALTLCRGHADYAWVLDADDLVIGTPDLSNLTSDSYLLHYGQDFRYWRKQLFRDGLRWRYEGVVHEYPVCDDLSTEARLTGDYYVESRRLGSRSADPHKYERDRDLLLDEVERNPSDARSVFYLAQSCFDAGDLESALRWYSRRVEMQGWDEETFCALLRRADCLSSLGQPWEIVESAYLEAWERHPTRAEPLHAIAQHHRKAGNYQLGYLFAHRAGEIPFPDQDGLFINSDVYTWRSLDEQAICLFHIGRPAESFELCRDLLAGDALPDSERERVASNRDLCVPALLELSGSYPAAIVQRLAPSTVRGSRSSEVTLTVTTCRRLAVFEKTVNLFLRCCIDTNRVGRWVCVDNGSSEADLKRIQDLYPFFEVVRVDPERGSHVDSLNLILELVDSPYWLHLEDDWQFFSPERMIERAIAVLEDEPSVAQVAFNVNYAETLEERTIVGGELRHTKAGQRYRLHRYLPPGREWDDYFNDLDPGARTNTYWPHFTLRPSLVRVAALRPVGTFDPDSGFFELDFARRYAQLGLTTAFFDEVVCLHIGRRTGQSAAEGTPSAYDLVGDGMHPGRGGGLAVRVVNLDRRPDRLASFVTRLERASPRLARRCQRFRAVDGTAISMTDELRLLFRDNDFGDRRGFVGCALSHLALWRQTADGSAAACLIFEDDAEVDSGFLDELRATILAVNSIDVHWDIVLLGYEPWPDAPREDPVAAADVRVRPMRWDRYLGGLYCYLLSRSGARRLVDLVERDGIRHGIDWFIMKQQAELSAFEVLVPLADSPLVSHGSDVDSDIQYDWEQVPPPATNLIPQPLAELVTSLVLAELRLELPEGWKPSDASIFADNDGFRVGVPVTTPDALENLVVRLNARLEVSDVEVQGDGADLRMPEYADLPPGSIHATSPVTLPRGNLCVVEQREAGVTGLRFVLFDDTRRVVAASSPFKIVAGSSEERCSGLVLRDDELILSFVIDQEAIGLAVLDTAEALGLLEPCL